MNNSDELLEQLKRAARTIEALRATVLTMCDDMDRALDIPTKEKVRLAITETEKLLDQAEATYNELIQEIRKS